MCGIVGVLGPGGGGETALSGLIETMCSCLSHRGPDDRGVWVDDKARLGLGHRRLSILDLSPTGHQPMVSTCGRYVITFNGEIYNYLDIRRDLEISGAAPAWRGHSDTEVILAAIARWGIGSALERMTGMFALALWDREDRTLHIARDRLGESHSIRLDETIRVRFGAQSAASPSVLEGPHRPRCAPSISPAGVRPAPHSIYQGVRKLTPGTFLSVRPTARARRRRTGRHATSPRGVLPRRSREATPRP